MPNYRVLSPDGFDIRRDRIYSSRREALRDTLDWIDGYETQGYYRTNNMEKIALDDLLDCCSLIPVEEEEFVECEVEDNKPF